MISAAGDGDVARIESLLASGADINAHDPHAWPCDTALFQAAYNGQDEAVRYLLKHGADLGPESVAYKVANALACAEVGHQATTVKLLLSAGARTDPNIMEAARDPRFQVSGTIRDMLEQADAAQSRLASASQAPAPVTPQMMNTSGEQARAPTSNGAHQGLRLQGRLAVLELRNFTKELTHENAQFLTDVVRQVALKANTGADVITRENLHVLLQASGKKMEDCEGECEVDTGRRIGADAIISGELQKLGSKYKLSLRLHDTHEGKLLASATGSGATIDELDDGVTKVAQELFEQR